MVRKGKALADPVVCEYPHGLEGGGGQCTHYQNS